MKILKHKKILGKTTEINKKIERKNNSFNTFSKKNFKSKKRAIFLMIICTLFISLGQIFMKMGSTRTGSVYEIVTNIALIFGFASYGIGALLLILALKHGDLSMVYPFIALSFIWVELAAIYLFNEHVSILNIMGLIAIILGVVFIGQGGER